MSHAILRQRQAERGAVDQDAMKRLKHPAKENGRLRVIRIPAKDVDRAVAELAPTLAAIAVGTRSILGIRSSRNRR